MIDVLHVLAGLKMLLFEFVSSSNSPLSIEAMGVPSSVSRFQIQVYGDDSYSGRHLISGGGLELKCLGRRGHGWYKDGIREGKMGKTVHGSDERHGLGAGQGSWPCAECRASWATETEP